jgi:hypothetical protein
VLEAWRGGRLPPPPLGVDYTTVRVRSATPTYRATARAVGQANRLNDAGAQLRVALAVSYLQAISSWLPLLPIWRQAAFLRGVVPAMAFPRCRGPWRCTFLFLHWFWRTHRGRGETALMRLPVDRERIAPL